MIEHVEVIHILIADGDAGLTAALAGALRAAGHRVSEAVDAAQALALATQSEPQLVLLEASLPDMPGLKLAQRLAERGVPFMLLSADREATTVKAVSDLGALGYLVKPLDVPQIIPEIEAALARAREIRELKQTGENLSQALESGRETNIAIGILMERQNLDRDRAFDVLRSTARSQRRRVHDVAAEIVHALETLNKPGSGS